MTLSGTSLQQTLATNPRAATGALRLLCCRLRDAAEQLEAIALHPIEVRLARFLLARIRHQVRAAEPGRKTVDLGMSKRDLALFIGASQPKLSVAFAALEEIGAIERQGASVVCDATVLERVVTPG